MVQKGWRLRCVASRLRGGARRWQDWFDAPRWSPAPRALGQRLSASPTRTTSSLIGGAHIGVSSASVSPLRAAPSSAHPATPTNAATAMDSTPAGLAFAKKREGLKFLEQLQRHPASGLRAAGLERARKGSVQ